jgi:hypothetical protein
VEEVNDPLDLSTATKCQEEIKTKANFAARPLKSSVERCLYVSRDPAYECRCLPPSQEDFERQKQALVNVS